MKNTLAIAFIIVIGLVFYAGTLKAVPGRVDSQTGLPTDPSVFGSTGPFESSHERSSYAIILAMVGYHNVNLTKDLADFGSPDVGFFKGKFYSFFPPGVASLGYPLYLLGERFNLPLAFAYFSVSLAAILTLIILYIICRQIFKFSLPLALLTVLITGFGTIFWNYSITLYQHIPTIFLMLFAFYSVWRFKSAKGIFVWLWALAVWICYGLGPVFDYPNVILLLPVMVYFFISALRISKTELGFKVSLRMAFLVCSLAMIILAGAQLYYNYRIFGNWKIYTNALPRYNQTDYDYAHLSNADTEAIAAQKGQVASIFLEKNVPFGFYILTVSVDKGLFLYMPVLLLALLGMFSVRKKITMEIGILAGIFLLNLFLYSSFADPWGGLSYGPRYLLPSIAVLPIFIGLWLQNSAKLYWLKKTAVFILFACSSAASLLGAVTRNIVFPKNEAVYVDTSNKFWFNIKYLKSGQSGSLLYNSVFSRYFSLTEYYFILLALILLIIFVVLFVLLREKNEPEQLNTQIFITTERQ